MKLIHVHSGGNYTTIIMKKHLPQTLSKGLLHVCACLLFLAVSVFSAEAQTAPTVVQLPQNISYETYGVGFTALEDWVEDNGGAVITPAAGCFPFTWTNNYDPSNFNATCGFYTGSIAVTFTYSDACGNTLSYTRTATLFDETPPTCIKPVDLTLDCADPDFEETLASYVAYWGPVTDLNHPITVTSSFDEDGFDENGQQTIVWTFTDACGNTTTQTAVLTVTGDCECVVSAGSLTIDENPVELGMDGTAVISASVSVAPTVPAGYEVIYVLTEGYTDLIIQQTSDTPSFTVTAAGEYTIHTFVYDPATFDLSFIVPGSTSALELLPLLQENGGDICASLDAAGAQVVVEDMDTEITVTPPADADLDCTDIVPDGNVFATTTCPDGVINVDQTEEVTPMGCPGMYTLVRTFVVSDNCGNSETVTQTITVTDTTPPVFTFVPEGGDVNCTAYPDGFGMAEAADACGDVTITFEDDLGTYICDADFPIVRTFTATDECGNTATAQQVLIVWPDVEPPVFTFVPADMTITCPATPEFGEVEVTDACTDFTVSEDITTTGSCPEGYTATKTWTAIDGCGNAASVSQTITVLPDPVEMSEITLTPPADLNLDCTATVPDGTATASTTCPGGVVNVEETETVTPMGCPGSFTLVRTYTATDECGNTATAQQTVIVTDTTPPVFTNVPASTDVDCTAYPDGFGPAPDAADACGAVTVTFEDVLEPYICDADFAITRTWTAVDECGNATSVSQTLTVWPDIEAPLFSFVPGDMTITCPAEPVFGEVEVSDVCSDFTVTEEITGGGDCPNGYTVTKTWTATDACGNSSSQSQTITVLAAPALGFAQMPEDKTIACTDDLVFDAPAMVWECPTGYTVDYNDSATEGYCDGEQFVTRTWVINDACGNSISCAQTVTLVDNEKPTFDIEAEELTMTAAAYAAWTAPEVNAFDECSSVEMTKTTYTLPDDRISHNWVAVDACGNKNSVSILVTVVSINLPDNPGGTVDILSGFTMYPNPAGESLQVDFVSEQGGETEIAIYDLTGQKRQVQMTSAYQGKNSERINLKDLPTGTYFIRINDGAQQAAKRFMKL